MEPGDSPEPTAAAKHSEVEDTAADRLDPLALLAPEADPRVFSEGEIKAMRLPAVWQKGASKDRDESKPYSYRVFNPSGRPDVLLAYFDRGYKLGDAPSRSFRDVLDKPPHVLLPAEINAVAEVLRDKSDPDDFKIVGAHTEVLNGKNVLVVEGRYVDAQEDAYTVYVDADGRGSTLRELQYRAPKLDYPRFLKDAKAAFQSIEWK